MPSRRVLAAASLLALAIIGFAITFAIGQGDENFRVQAADAQNVADAIGRPLPEPRFRPLGLYRSALTVDPAGVPVPRAVQASYAIAGKNVMLLVVRAGTITAPGVPQQIGDVSAIVSTKTLDDGSTDVAYTWSRNGLAYAVHINLSRGLNRDLADQVVASIP